VKKIQSIEFKQCWCEDFGKAGFVESLGRCNDKVSNFFTLTKQLSPTFENLLGRSLVVVPRNNPDGKTSSAEKFFNCR